MDIIDPYKIIVIIIALLFAAFFSGTEAAFLAVDKLCIEFLKKPKRRSSKILTVFAQHPRRFITTMLIGNTMALVVYSSYIAELFDNILSKYFPYIASSFGLSVCIQTLLTTFIVLIIGELIPKSIFLQAPCRLLVLFAFPIAITYYILYPLVIIGCATTSFFMKYILRSAYEDKDSPVGLTDLSSFIKRQLVTGTVPQMSSIKMSASFLDNLLELKSLQVRDCMVPRAKLVAINKIDGIPALKSAAMRSGHSKILVYKENIDNIIGYCHVRELLRNPSDIDSILIPIMEVSSASLASDIMLQLMPAYRTLALAVDEFGGVEGVVSLEDFIEKIVGDIQDEYDKPILIEKELATHVYLLSASHKVEYLNKKYGWNIPLGNYDTLGGFIISIIHTIPSLHQTIEAAGLVCNIVALSESRIEMVQITVKPNARKDIY